MHQYDPTGCLRTRRKEQRERMAALNITIGCLFVSMLLGGAWLVLHYFPN